MEVLYIHQCTDDLMWYRNSVGCFVPYHGIESDDTYWSLEPVGYKNIVRAIDAVVVHVKEVRMFTEHAVLLNQHGGVEHAKV